MAQRHYANGILENALKPGENYVFYPQPNSHPCPSEFPSRNITALAT